MTKETKSPIKNLPVHTPGQSLAAKIDDVFTDDIFVYIMVAMVMILLAVIEWFRFFQKTPPSPIPYTVFALLILAYSSYRISKGINKIKALRLGLKGEKAVGQFLDEKLRPMGYQVLHDVVGDDFNVDHLAIGPTGIFAIETKTHSKPAKGECRVVFDGEKVTVNGFAPDRDPIIQAKAEAKWVSELLVQSTSRKFHVQPIILYPGWFVETTKPNPDIYVINDTLTPTYIKNARNSLSDEDIAMITFHLKRYVIARDTVK